MVPKMECLEEQSKSGIHDMLITKGLTAVVEMIVFAVVCCSRGGTERNFITTGV